MKEAFAELDMTSDTLEILLSPSAPYFRLSTCGYAGTTQVHMVNHCAKVLFVCMCFVWCAGVCTSMLCTFVCFENLCKYFNVQNLDF